ncbi:MAG: hypothetical protein Tp1111DCM1126091_27 [Prokaryotic dsDNA virus sp.]|nr:MAG: hypothetical protein Tp1111DCM1126091_27 [Prokaryotic dsDNA virus sp.]|tara:strand:- start:2817 stop:2972 length:156 start_codon:yes stop_codon:yes gene_type:complete
MNGYQLLTQEQREDLDRLVEKNTHADITPLEAAHIRAYEVLCAQLEIEYSK